MTRYPLTAAQRRTRAAQIFVAICLVLAVIGAALLVVRVAGAAPVDEMDGNGRGRTVSVSVPAGSVVWVCPEAGKTLRGISWRCSTSRRWLAVAAGGFSPACGRVVIWSRSTWFDVEVLAGGGSPL